MNSENEFQSLKKNGDSSCFHSSIPSSDWRYVGGADLANPMSCKTDILGAPVSSVDSYFQWENQNNPDSLSFCNISLQSDSSHLGFRKGFPNMSGISPPVDSGFVDRAAKVSSINALNLSDMLNRFGCGESVIPDNELNVAETDRLKMAHGGIEEGLLKDERKHDCLPRVLDDRKVGFGLFGNGDAEFSNSGESESSAKKRKKTNQLVELNQSKGVEIANCGNQNLKNGEQNPTSISNKCVGKNVLELPKDEYIHVRARRGQASNSHSLAERVRREKISERMKLLQDLVPGCSKVTGKAVMLDEIINYVQSLQRQVELLSMKLATVNPQLDLNIDRLVAKDVGPSSLGFSQDSAMAYAQPGLIQSGLPILPSLHISMMNIGFREPPQFSNVWEDELHNVVQMSIETAMPSNTQHLNDPHRQMKIEL